MRFLLSSAAALLLICSASATPQIPDTLVIEDRIPYLRREDPKHAVYGLPLPPKVLERLEAWKKKRGHDSVSSANWAGYTKTLRLRNGRLYIDSVEVPFAGATGDQNVQVPLDHLFRTRAPVHAEWFSGELEEYLGRPVGYTHVSRRARVYSFEQGRLRSIKEKRVR